MIADRFRCFFWFWIAVVLSSVPAFAGTPKGEPADEVVVATWNDGRIERAEYLDWLKAQGLEDSPEALREMVFVRSLAAIAEESLDPRAARRVELDVEARRQRLLLPLLRRHVVTRGEPIAEAELEALRRAHPDAFTRPRQLRLRNLFKAFGDETEASAVRAAMAEIHRRLAEGADFEELARRESESQSRFRGGRLGLVDPEQLPESLAAAVRELEAGQITPPLEHAGGVTIFLCEEVRPARNPTPEEVKAKLRVNLERKRALERWAAAREALLEGASLDLARRGVELGLDREPEIAARLRWLRTEALARRELTRRVDERLEEPDEAALRREHAARPDRFRQFVAYELATIHFGDPDALATAQDVARRLADGEIGFEEAARRHSVDPSAADGGYLGWRTPFELTDWGPTASRAIRELEPGAATDLLHLESGLWIFRLLDHRAPRPSTFAEARSQIYRELRARRIRELEQILRTEHLEAIGVHLEAEPVVVRWSTASEHECFGYHVYRAAHEDGPFERLTEEVVEGGGTTDLPHHYRFEDPEVEVGETYYYYVESVATDGNTERLTPVRAVEARRVSVAEPADAPSPESSVDEASREPKNSHPI